MRLDKRTDEELLLQIPSGQKQEVLTILYKRYEKRIYFKALTLVKDRQLAQDLTHDIFIKIFTKLVQFKGTSAFSLWVHSITINTCLNHMKRTRKAIFHEFDAGDEEHFEDNRDSEDKMLKEIKINQLEEIISTLGQGEQLLIMMKYVDGMSIREMEEILDLGESAIKMRLKRIRDKILSNYNHIKEQNGQ
ncbi:MAG: RNA polymerase sigma factor [Saprospiraceae bacterium]|nr:RNA polymerase sigma factor [Saprospiraceae bacterium]